MAKENVVSIPGETPPPPVPELSTTPPDAPPAPAPVENADGVQPENKAGRVFRKIVGKLGGIAARRGIEFRKGKGRPKKCRECDGDGCESCNFTGIVPGKADFVSGGPLPTPAPLPAVGVEKPVVGDSAAVVPPTLPPANPSHRALLHRSIISGVKGILGGLDAYCRSLARRAGMSSDDVSRTFDGAKPDAQSLDDLSESLSVVLEKHNVNTEHAPEIALAVTAGKIVAPYAVAIYEIRAFIKRQEAKGTA